MTRLRLGVAAAALLAGLGLALAVVLIWILVERWRAATPMLRRALTPVLATSSLTAALIGVSVAVDYASQNDGDRIFEAALVAYAAVPLAFLAGLVRSRLARAAVAGLVLRLARAHQPGDVRDALREALADPALELAYWLPDAEGYVDEEGRPFVLPEETPEREELRELARGIHPAVLSDRGLRAALEGLAARTPLPVELAVTPAERLPDQVEAAAYYVVAESLTNVAKYAGATAVTVSITRQNGSAVIEVSDNGIGGADPHKGSGLRGLLDRVEALDGWLDVASDPGWGTKIRAEIPCA